MKNHTKVPEYRINSPCPVHSAPFRMSEGHSGVHMVFFTCSCVVVVTPGSSIYFTNKENAEGLLRLVRAVQAADYWC